MHQVCRSLDYADRYIIWCTWYTCNHFCDTSARWLYNLNLNRWFERMTSSWWTSIRPHQTLWIGFPWERSSKHMNKSWRLCLCLLCWNICSFQSESKGFHGVRVRFSDHFCHRGFNPSSSSRHRKPWLVGRDHPLGNTGDLWSRVVQGSLQLARRFFQGALHVGALKRKKGENVVQLKKEPETLLEKLEIKMKAPQKSFHHS